MADELLGYYNSELGYLRKLGAEFAAKYPRVAGRLALEAEKCEDPHVERLLEGFAFLTARLRSKVDDEFPEISDSILNLVAPHYLRPLPSACVVEFSLGNNPLDAANGIAIPRGQRLLSKPVGGVPCTFRTADGLTLWPIEVASASLEPDRVVAAEKPPEAVALLRVELRALAGVGLSTFPLKSLRFYLDGNGPEPYALHELLLNHACKVVVRGTSPDGSSRSITLPPDCIKPVGFGRDEGLYPFPGHAFLGYRLLLEYFAFPEKFLFVDLTGLDAIAQAHLGERAEILVFLNSPPRGELPISAANLRLGCVPAINLFEKVAEPIALTHAKTEYRVVPDAQRPLAHEVYAIESVTSAGSFLEDAITYEPFSTIRHASEPDRLPGADPPPYWHATRRRSARKDDPGTEVDIAFVNRTFLPDQPARETVTLQLLCTNRDLPSKLPFGGDGGDFEPEGQVPVGRVRCVTMPTKPLRPPVGRHAFWRLIGHLSLNHLSLADSTQGLHALQEILSAHDYADTAATRQQIRGITRVSSRSVPGRLRRSIGSAVCLGTEVTIEFDESSYVGSGAFLLACVLERFLGLYVSINGFSQLVATSRQREEPIRRWPPRSGERSLL